MINHHGAVSGVTGSCHELRYTHRGQEKGVLIDCGLFQGDEALNAELQNGGRPDKTQEQLLSENIPFPIDHIAALVVTHVHIDHVGRIPYLIAKGFDAPIYCTVASAHLLPLVLEDALKVGFTRNQALIDMFLSKIKQQIRPLAYNQIQHIDESLSIKLSPAGHILGSAYVTCELKSSSPPRRGTNPKETKTIIFSGDLGASQSPIIRSFQSPEACDELVLESTYGDKNHEDRVTRQQRLQKILERALEDGGTVLIPAFSIGRTQELLYEIEDILHNNERNSKHSKLNVMVDSPLAAQFTQSYRELKHLWDDEAQAKLKQGRHPLNFDELTTIESHKEHLETIDYLVRSRKPAIVIAASGMCNGGRIMNYLKAMLGENRNDLLFVGYQASGTIGRLIQKYGPKGGYVDIDGKRIIIKANIHTISGYSAHADQSDLKFFVRGMKQKPKKIRLIHGDGSAKRELRAQLNHDFPDIDVIIPEK
ncbi:MBL fold metallo-hydrolase [Bermanella marisrubri]|uniref:Metallo-beta-lactamase family protein n=1 Tax=Bermanella marisrubri TaxID=207949 RepID=Q1N5C8_9GAMM|nr:MBL fold metallo-hydrolase [Bermanella marisrubri]EAT13129.1 metallo-beta-lactamase family protein [Oceanobacter sp. RED65] [Bermanella marisrubri]QIZ83906.1 MBL fold metallo-hydrolase [Bermanella marisrubri]